MIEMAKNVGEGFPTTGAPRPMLLGRTPFPPHEQPAERKRWNEAGVRKINEVSVAAGRHSGLGIAGPNMPPTHLPLVLVPSSQSLP